MKNERIMDVRVASGERSGLTQPAFARQEGILKAPQLLDHPSCTIRSDGDVSADSRESR